MAVEIGSGQLIPGFEDQLVGVKAGDEKTVKVTFPEEYPVENLKGKDAEFAVTVKTVKVPADSKIDDEFAKSLGLESLKSQEHTTELQPLMRIANDVVCLQPKTPDNTQ